MPGIRKSRALSLVANKNIVDGDVNQLDKETNETHDGKSNAGRLGNLREFLSVRLSAFLHQVHGVLGKIPHRLDCNFVESLVSGHFQFSLFVNLRFHVMPYNTRQEKKIARPRSAKPATKEIDTDSEGG